MFVYPHSLYTMICRYLCCIPQSRSVDFGSELQGIKTSSSKAPSGQGSSWTRYSPRVCRDPSWLQTLCSTEVSTIRGETFECSANRCSWVQMAVIMGLFYGLEMLYLDVCNIKFVLIYVWICYSPCSSPGCSCWRCWPHVAADSPEICVFVLRDSLTAWHHLLARDLKLTGPFSPALSCWPLLIDTVYLLEASDILWLLQVASKSFNSYQTHSHCITLTLQSAWAQQVLLEISVRAWSQVKPIGNGRLFQASPTIVQECSRETRPSINRADSSILIICLVNSEHLLYPNINTMVLRIEQQPKPNVCILYHLVLHTHVPRKLDHSSRQRYIWAPTLRRPARQVGSSLPTTLKRTITMKLNMEILWRH